MRQVVNTIPPITNLIELKDLTSNRQDCFGVLLYSGLKAFITADTFNEDYSLRDIVSFTHGNHLSYGVHKSVHNCIRSVLENPRNKVFIFDSPKKLFKWLSE